MSQWFRGQLEGHYVGLQAGGLAQSQVGSGQRYKLRIYQALIRDIDVLGPANTPEVADPPTPSKALPLPVDLPADCFYQAKIDDARLLGIRRNACLEGTVYEVALVNFKVTHSSTANGKTYGRIVGEVYARFLLPASSESHAEETEALRAVEAPLRGSDEFLVDDDGKALSDLESSARGERDMETLHAPRLAEEREGEPARVPIPLLVFVMAVVLGLSVGGEPALLWLGLFIPILVVRLIIGSQFKINLGQRIFGATLVLIQFVCMGAIFLTWWEAGCMSINPWAIAGIGITALMASVLPSSVPLLMAGASLGLVLFLYYGDVGRTCEGRQATPAAVEEPAQRPRVDDPGVPRTNKDGSWPRRPPRRTQ